MSKSTGPALAVGAITWGNQIILSKNPPPDVVKASLRIAIGTAGVAALLYGVEKVNKPMGSGLAWIALVTVCLARIDRKPSPVENLRDRINAL